MLLDTKHNSSSSSNCRSGSSQLKAVVAWTCVHDLRHNHSQKRGSSGNSSNTRNNIMQQFLFVLAPAGSRVAAEAKQ